jgi:hypothetical protein
MRPQEGIKVQAIGGGQLSSLGREGDLRLVGGDDWRKVILAVENLALCA